MGSRARKIVELKRWCNKLRIRTNRFYLISLLRGLADRREIPVLTSDWIRSDEGLTLKTSALKSRYSGATEANLLLVFNSKFKYI